MTKTFTIELEIKDEKEEQEITKAFRLIEKLGAKTIIGFSNELENNYILKTLVRNMAKK